MMLSRFESLAGLSRFVPSALAGLGAKAVGPLLGMVDLPTPAKAPAGSKPPTYSPGMMSAPGTELIVIMPDVFTATLEPATLTAAVDVLGRLGYMVAVSEFVASGKFDHVKGRRAAFAKAAKVQADMVDAILADGATPVVIEPAIALLHNHEYRATVPAYPVGVRYLAQVIDQRIGNIAPAASPLDVTLLGHCTERATGPGWLPAWSRILDAAGHTVTAPDVGCCGMAGIFGHERGNQDMSRKLFDMTWADHVKPKQNYGGRKTAVVATGYSCRSQAKRLVDESLLHPIHLL